MKKPLPTSLPRTSKLRKTKWGDVTYQAWGLGDQSKLLQRIVGEDVAPEERYDALRELLSSCVLSYVVEGKEVNPVEMPVFLSELILVLIRAISIGEEAAFTKNCDKCVGEDGKHAIVNMVTNLEDSYILETDDHEYTKKVGDYTFELQYPTFRGSLEMSELETLDNISEELASRFIKTVYNDSDAWIMSDYTQAEKNEFMQLLGSDFQTFILKSFVQKMPVTKLKLEGMCPRCGHDHSTEVSGVSKLFSI